MAVDPLEEKKKPTCYRVAKSFILSATYCLKVGVLQPGGGKKDEKCVCFHSLGKVSINNINLCQLDNGKM